VIAEIFVSNTDTLESWREQLTERFYRQSVLRKKKHYQAGATLRVVITASKTPHKTKASLTSTPFDVASLPSECV